MPNWLPMTGPQTSWCNCHVQMAFPSIILSHVTVVWITIPLSGWLLSTLILGSTKPHWKLRCSSADARRRKRRKKLLPLSCNCTLCATVSKSVMNSELPTLKAGENQACNRGSSTKWRGGSYWLGKHKIPTHERFKSTLYILGQDNMWIVGKIPLIKLQKDT